MFLVGIEAIFTGIIVGILKDSLLWGIGAWLLLQGIYFVPYIGSSVTMFTSVIEAIVTYEILTSLNVSSEIGRFFISLFSFIILVFIHRQFAQTYGDLDNDSQMGYGWLIFESISIAAFIHYYINSVTWAIITFILLLVLSFIPKVRVIEYIVLSVWTGLIVYEEFNNIVTNKYAIIGAICIFIFSGIMYMLAFEKLDYKGYKKAKEERKKLEEELLNNEMLKVEMYQKYPELEKEYYYFYTVVCKTELEKEEFLSDWIAYLDYLDETDTWISFNDYFDIKKLYRYHFYNREFAKNYQSEMGRKKKEKFKRFYIDCNYDEKDIVKNLGASWDYEKKKWYFINSEDKIKFEKWLPKGVEENIYSKNNVDAYECPNFERIEFKKLGLNYDNYLIIDTETTGLQNDDEIVELAVVNLEGKELYHSLYKPEKSVHWEASKKTGISNKMLLNSPFFKDEWLKIKDIVEGKSLIAHNVDFDYRLVKQTLNRYGLEEEDADIVFTNCIDSIKIAKKYVDSTSYKLEELCKVLGIEEEEEQKHRATYDCLMILKMLRIIENM